MVDTSLDKSKTIYDQDCQFYRYQDQKKWERFKTAALLEGAIFYALYGTDRTGILEKRVAFLGGFLLLLIVLLISLKDQVDADAFLVRMRRYEMELPFPGAGRFRLGQYLMWMAIVALLGLNEVLGLSTWR